MSSNDDRYFNEILRKLSNDERKVIKYFITYRSVGELLAVRELRGLYKIKDPTKVIAKLIDLGVLSRGIGCYNISEKFLKYIKRRGGKIEI